MRIEAAIGRKTVGKTITETDVMLFNDLFNPSESDGLENSRQVPELLILMTAIGLLNRSLPLEEKLIAVTGQSWEFNHPVFTEDTLFVQYDIGDLIETKNFERKIAVVDLRVVIQGSVMIATGKWDLLITDSIC